MKRLLVVIVLMMVAAQSWAAACAAGEQPFKADLYPGAAYGATAQEACSAWAAKLGQAAGQSGMTGVVTSSAACMPYLNGGPFGNTPAVLTGPNCDGGQPQPEPPSTPASGTVVSCASACTVTHVVQTEITTPLLSLTPSEGGQIAIAIVAVWVVGFGIRAVARTLNTDGEPSTKESE